MSAADPLDLLVAYQHSAVVAAAVETGVADAIAPVPASAEDVARACAIHPGGAQALLGAMAALELAEHGPEGYSLSETGAVLASGHPHTIASIVRKEWFFYRAWAGLPDTVRDGHARIAPWTDRLRDDPGQSLEFLRALDDLAARFGGELPGLAGDAVGPGDRLLDVGGGAGSHAANLAAEHPGLQATVLDLAAAEPVVRERHPELAFVAGDLAAPRLGRPEGETWDVVLLANVLHDHPPATCARIVSACAGLLAPGGRLVVYEWVLHECRDSPRDVALFALMMMVENDGGAAYTEPEIVGWIDAAGLRHDATRRGFGPIAAVVGSRE